MDGISAEAAVEGSGGKHRGRGSHVGDTVETSRIPLGKTPARPPDAWDGASSGGAADRQATGGRGRRVGSGEVSIERDRDGDRGSQRRFRSTGHAGPDIWPPMFGSHRPLWRLNGGANIWHPPSKHGHSSIEHWSYKYLRQYAARVEIYLLKQKLTSIKVHEHLFKKKAFVEVKTE